MDSEKINDFLASQLNNLPMNNMNELDSWRETFLEIC